MNHNYLHKIGQPLIEWYEINKRDLPWRKTKNPYHIWISEIMLQQTRVEAVKPYYERFLTELPDVQALAEVPEERLLKLWEGLGYYNRARNLQKAARQIVESYGGIFPAEYDMIIQLAGIGNYTAGAISSFAFNLPKPAVDGNVLRVYSRLTASYEDIMKQSVRNNVERELEAIIVKERAGDFNQALIELGATVCVPNGAPRCEVCPLSSYCMAKQQGVCMELPVKSKAKSRRIENRTILIFRDGDNLAIRKRPKKGLLAGMYEYPGVEGHLTQKQVIAYAKSIGLMPVRVKRLPDSVHIFSHVEWHMKGYEVRVDELEKSCTEKMLFVHPDEIERVYPIPSAFTAYKSV